MPVITRKRTAPRVGAFFDMDKTVGKDFEAGLAEAFTGMMRLWANQRITMPDGDPTLT